ncbi:MAG: hypothetical protein NZM37_09590 [Sandaracinaceae bacterium]|nr:hypothetical protein [Sandaracinaceae bacterium]
MPRGGYVALRLDFERIRNSPLRSDVERLLESIPDWRLLLGTTGVEPLRDFGRMLIATPDLQRSSLIVIGEVASDHVQARELAEEALRLAGLSPEWQVEQGFLSLPWPSIDEVERKLVLFDERSFCVARPEDLERILGIAEVRAKRQGASSMIEGLLGMPPKVGLSLEVEGVSNYVRRSPCPLPLDFVLHLQEELQRIRLFVEARYPTEVERGDAVHCFGELKNRLVSNPFVALLGFAQPLEFLTFEGDGVFLRVHTYLTYTHLRNAIRSVEDWFRRKVTRNEGEGGEDRGSPRVSE